MLCGKSEWQSKKTQIASPKTRLQNRCDAKMYRLSMWKKVFWNGSPSPVSFVERNIPISPSTTLVPGTTLSDVRKINCWSVQYYHRVRNWRPIDLRLTWRQVRTPMLTCPLRSWRRFAHTPRARSRLPAVYRSIHLWVKAIFGKGVGSAITAYGRRYNCGSPMIVNHLLSVSGGQKASNTSKKRSRFELQMFLLWCVLCRLLVFGP